MHVKVMLINVSLNEQLYILLQNHMICFWKYLHYVEMLEI